MLRNVLGIVGVSSLLFAASLTLASAADMPVKAPAVSAAYNWSGCYVGANAGFDFERFGDTLNTTGGVVAIPGIGLVPFAPGSTGLAQHGTSPAAGLQGGCRWESADHAVLGFEGDFDWTNLRGTSTVINVNPPFPCTTGICNGDTVADRAQWQGSARLIFGRSFDRWLAYATGGWALTRATMTATFIPVIFNGVPFAGSTGSDTKLMNGFIIGAGAAYRLSSNWEIGAEYRYTFYPQTASSFNLGTGVPPCFVGIGGIGCASTAATGNKSLDVNEVLVKLNYRFN